MRKSWIAVACAQHVRRGVEMGFMQVCHGKASPLKRIKPGDRVAYYSPSELMRRPDGLQSFTALGIVLDSPVHQVDMGDGFRPFRREVRYFDAQPASVRPLIERQGFALSGTKWGSRLRFGLIDIDEASMDMIAQAMNARMSRVEARIS
jgi:hypothetical protein